MAETWRILSGVANTVGIPIALYNNGSRVLRVYKVYYKNTITSSVTGVIGGCSLIKIVAPSGVSGSNLSPMPHDSNNTSLDTVSSLYNATITGSALVVRRFAFSTDEPSISSLTIDEWSSSHTNWFVVFDATGDSHVTPIVLRNNEVFYVQLAASYTGTAQWIFEFTNEAS